MVDRNVAVPDDLDGLERKYFVHNVMKDPEPGEQEHEEDMDDSDFSEDQDTAHLELDEIMNPKNAVMVEDEDDWSKVLTQHRPKNNTGGKGVLEDYKEATKIKKRRNETKVLKQREAWKQIGYNGQNAPLTQAQTEKKPGLQQEQQDEESSDDEMFAQFRAMRLAQLQQTSGLPRFGKVYPVGKFKFVDEVDQADPRTYVIIHLYEDYILTCQRMNSVFDILASRYPHVKFLKLKATEADQTLSHSLLPGIMVYKNQALLGNASSNVPLKELKTEKFTTEDVEWLLCAKYGVPLPGVDVTEQERAQRNKQVEDDERQRLGAGIVQRYEG